MQAGSSCVFLYQKQMNVQFRHGWVLQKGQFLMVLHFSSTPFCRACLRCHFPSSIIKRFQLGASGWQAEIPNFGAHALWNYWVFKKLSTGKREQRLLAVLGSSSSSTEHPELLPFPSRELLSLLRWKSPLLLLPELFPGPTWSHKVPNNPQGTPAVPAAIPWHKTSVTRAPQGTPGEPAVLPSAH